MKIKLLDKSVINQISAGEVVEKPASIVKELVENSIDAGATNITIEIKEGGIKYISVTDNGHGINKDEVKLAFTPHATSKLEKIDDLNSLCTMGFRGEALATISAVSRVTLATKTKDVDTGIKVKLEGGEEISRSEIACVTGTKIEVEDVFYNTPARLKFLRKPKAEEGDITNYVNKLILSHSSISFKYIVDEKVIYNTSNCSLLDNIYTIYGKDVADNVLEVGYSLNGYKLSGYVSKPEFAKANRSYQNLFVNNRFCNNALISSAVSQAYENFTMKGKFPLYVLFLTLPQDEVDVNVHPNKLEVKFVNSRKIYALCVDAVFEALSNFNHIRNVDIDVDEQRTELISTTSIIDNNLINKQIEINPDDNKVDNSLAHDIQKDNKPIEGVSFEDKELQKARDSYLKSFEENQKNTGSFRFELTENLLPTIELDRIIEKDKEQIEKSYSEVKQEEYKNLFNEEFRIVGKIFNTYLILEQNESMYLIDQHAAHERQKYDQIIIALENNNLIKQDLMFPYIFSTSTNESNYLLDNLDLLNEFGIEIDEFGNNSFKVSAVPLILDGINLKDFFDEVLKNLNSYAKSPKDIIKEKFMQMACKSAVKGGDDLKDMEIKTLLTNLKEKTEVLLCPHGRPIIVEIDKKQIEKWFKRIV